MNKYKKMFKNTSIFAISNFSSKFLVFLMLPLYTRAMSTADFGKADLIITTVSFLIPIFTLSVAEGALRFAIDKDFNKNKVFTFGLKIIFLGFIFLILCYPILIKIDVIKEYILIFYLLYITSSLSNYFNQFVRGIEKIRLIGIVGIVSTIVNVLSNILFLVIFKFGIQGYLIAYLLMNTVSIIVLFYNGKLYEYFYKGNLDKKLTKKMNEYNIPLIPSKINWWFIIVSDRYIVKYFCGVTAVGVVSAAYKIPIIITTVYSIIQQALLLSIISDYDKNDSEIFFGRIYNFMNVILLLTVSCLILIVKPISRLLFGNEFYAAWKLIPLLSVSILFGSLHGFLTTIFSAVKQTKILIYNSLVGAVASIIANIIFVYHWGYIGAAFANLLTYFIVWALLLKRSRKYIKFTMFLSSDLICYVILISQAILVTFTNYLNSYLVSFICILLVVIIKFKQIYKILCILKNTVVKIFIARRN